MELTMTNSFGFCELNEQEMMMVDGGGMSQTLAAFGGIICMGFTPVIGIAAGIGGSVVGTPLVGICAGITAASTMVAAGSAMLDYACK